MELILRLAAFFAVESLLMLECPGRLNKAKESGKALRVHPQITKKRAGKKEQLKLLMQIYVRLFRFSLYDALNRY